MASPHQLDTLILFVTSRCNSKCRTCFYWEQLNQDGDLSFEELQKLSRTMPPFNELWLSGGEPTLREDLHEVVSLFHSGNAVRSVNLPVNGLLPAKLIGILETILGNSSTLRLNVNLALDGLETTHDRIRGVPGNFQRAMESLEALQDLRRREPQLRVHVNSVICAENTDDMLPLGELVRDRFDLDGHYFQVIRGEPMEPTLTTLNEPTIGQLYRNLQPIYRHYAHKVSQRKKGIKSWLGEVAYLGTLNLYHQIQAANLREHSRWPMACTAGRNIVVLDANGDIRACELRERLGNLRNYDCDWSQFWDSTARNKEIEAIPRDGCWCTHVCFIHASLKDSHKAKWVDVPRAYVEQIQAGRPKAGFEKAAHEGEI